MQYDTIQGQGHEPLKVGNPSIFKRYLLCHLQWELETDHWFLNYGTISNFFPAGFFILVFCITCLWTWEKRQSQRVDHQSRTGLIYLYCCFLCILYVVYCVAAVVSCRPSQKHTVQDGLHWVTGAVSLVVSQSLFHVVCWLCLFCIAGRICYLFYLWIILKEVCCLKNSSTCMKCYFTSKWACCDGYVGRRGTKLQKWENYCDLNRSVWWLGRVTWQMEHKHNADWSNVQQWR